MKNITVFSNRLDESTGIVENVLEMKATTKKAPWFLRFAPKAKGLVSFVQNLLSPLTQKEASAAAVVLAGISFLKAKKAVSPVAAAVVGIGLFLAPMESAQANHGDIPIVLSVSLDGCFTPSPFDDVFDWQLSGVSDHWPLGYGQLVKYRPPSGVCLYDGDYVVVRLKRILGWSPQLRRWVTSPSEWVEIWFWFGNDDFEPSAYVEDSEGNSYYVDLYVDGYGPWPTGRRN